MKKRRSNLIFHVALLASVFAFLMTENLWASAKVNIKGYLVLESDPYRFVDSETLKSYKLRMSTDSAKQAILKLNNFDSISGVAVQYDDETLLLESVEFVGLRRLIGKWKSNEGFYQFFNYNDAAISDKSKNVQLTYALSPGLGNSWRLFFTDSSTVTLGSIQIESEKATIETYDADTGAILKTLPLIKVKD